MPYTTLELIAGSLKNLFAIMSNELEQRVEERTAALAQANAALVEQMAERQRIEDELLKVRRSITHSL